MVPSWDGRGGQLGVDYVTTGGITSCLFGVHLLVCGGAAVMFNNNNTKIYFLLVFFGLNCVSLQHHIYLLHLDKTT